MCGESDNPYQPTSPPPHNPMKKKEDQNIGRKEDRIS